MMSGSSSKGVARLLCAVCPSREIINAHVYHFIYLFLGIARALDAHTALIA